jgi:hypothetical protein
MYLTAAQLLLQHKDILIARITLYDTQVFYNKMHVISCHIAILVTM